MAISRKALSPGTYIFGGSRDYRVVRPLGSGGFGITYLVEAELAGTAGVTAYFAMKEHFLDNRCDRASGTTEVKYSAPVASEVEHSLQDFIGEANRLKNLGDAHSNIVRVHEIFKANNTAYYVMEYLEGQALRQYVGARGSLTPAETRLLLTPIADALRFLHSHRLTHLDVKPDNIMLGAEENGAVRPVLIDFGLSKHYDESGKPTSTVNFTGCSNGYSPVEQYGGLSEFQPTADIYALGATMMFCLTGRDPRRATELLPGEILGALSGIPGNMPLLIEAMMATQRNVRPQTMERVIDALGEPSMVSLQPFSGGGLEQPPVPPAPPQPPVAPPVRKKGKKAAIAVVAVAAVIVMLVAGSFLVGMLAGAPKRVAYADGGYLFEEYTTVRTLESHSRFLTGVNLPNEPLGVILEWDNDVDMDLLAVEPGGAFIYFGNTSTTLSGAHFGGDSFGGYGSQETIVWLRPRDGVYRFFARVNGAIPEKTRVRLRLVADGTEDISDIELTPLTEISAAEPEYFLLGTYEKETI